ncbi:MAG: hypothetical protein GOU98_02445 [Candidatus Altiarchaeota archaeon]|nr:hypothetical protein [Candidatus Altiarchaeota archaeon]
MSKYGHRTYTTILRDDFFSKWDEVFEEDQIVGKLYHDLKSEWKSLKTKKTFDRDHPILHDVLMLEYLRRRIEYQQEKIKNPSEFIINTIPQTYREVTQESIFDIDSINTSFSGRYDPNKEGEYDLSFDLLTEGNFRYKVIVEFKSNCNKGNKSDQVIENGWNQLKDSIRAGQYKKIVKDGTLGIYFVVVKPFNASLEEGNTKKVYGYLPEHISGFKENVRTILLPNYIMLPDFQTVYS